MRSYSTIHSKLAPPSNPTTSIPTHPWTEDSLVAYKNFCQFNGLDSDFVNTISKVHTHDGSFYPLSGVLNSNLKCSKVTIRNFKDGCFTFTFNKDIIPGILGMNTFNPKTAEQVQIAYRNIVPEGFSQYAGRLGLHEYIIDGKDYKETAMISFFANSDVNYSPIKIVLENCNEGMCLVRDLNDEAIAKIFENRCKANASFTFNSSCLKEEAAQPEILQALQRRFK